MDNKELKKNIYYAGVSDPERRLFDELIPLPDGTTYNAYLIKGSEATALIDTADPPMTDVLLKNIEDAGIENIDYIISQHGEQDHSGSIGELAGKYPDAVIVTNEKCRGMLIDLLHIPEDRFMTVLDGETLSLGDKTLEFIFTPWVHWPETISTYLKEDKVLFSCDFFGSHYAFSKLMISDNDLERVMPAAKRYYGEIMLPFGSIIRKNLEKLESYQIDMIAPSHGPIHDETGHIMDAYREWSSGKLANTVAIPYVSMHGSTRKMVMHLKGALEKKGISVVVFHLSEDDLGDLASALIDAATVVIGTPTVLAGPHPAAVYAAYLARALRPPVKFLSIVGSYGWGGKTVEILGDLAAPMKAEIIEPVIIRGYPLEKDFKALDELAEKIDRAHKGLGDDLKKA
jgi:flavorubredoxin